MVSKHERTNQVGRLCDSSLYTGSAAAGSGFNGRPDTNGEWGDPAIDAMIGFTGSSMHKYTRDGQPLAIYPLVRPRYARPK